jgi:hypothetical protein
MVDDPLRAAGGGTPAPAGTRARRVAELWERPPFLLLAGLLLAVFMASRLAFFWVYPTVGISQDLPGYLAAIEQVKHGHWPHFVFRTPLYSLFIGLIKLITDRWIFVLYAQNFLSLAASLALVGAVRLYRPTLALAATIAMCGFLGSSQVVLYDVALLSESLYTSCVILAAGFLILSFQRWSPLALALCSAFMALAVLTRPSGLYFTVIYSLVTVFLLWNRLPGRSIAAFAVPLPVLLLGFCAYNLGTIGSFTINPFGDSNLAGATALYWEPDPGLPEVVNRAFKELPESYAEADISPAELRLLRTSWDRKQVFELYAKAYNRMLWSVGWGTGSRFKAGTYLQTHGFIRDAAFSAIRRHPDLYAKFVWVNLVEFYRGVGFDFDIRSSLAYRETGDYSAADAGAKGAAVPGAAKPEAAWPDRALNGLQLAWQWVQDAIFQRLFWSWAYFAVLILSAVQLIRSRGRHLGAALLFALALIPLGASLVVCLVQIAMDRYSYPTQFAYYLVVALAPLLWQPGAPRRDSTQAQAGA